MIIEHYSLYCLLPTRENIDRLAQYEMATANRDHCLIIAQEKPEGAEEVKEEDYRLLDTSDWGWIFEMSNKIRREQEEKYHTQLIEKQKEFFSRFEELLKQQKRDLEHAGTNDSE